MANRRCDIIVTGAGGRMGSLLVNTILASPNFNLAGATESETRLKAIENLPCAVSPCLNDVLSAFPKAIVIDFTAPAVTMKNAADVAMVKGNIVIGTTGLNEEDQKNLAFFAKDARVFWSANMSVGINALLDILPQLVTALGNSYDLEIMEVHHKRKKDSPSGTALMLAKALANSRGWDISKVRNSSRDGIIGERPSNEIGVQALRGGDVVGIHSVWFLGPGETIEITHQAQSRENFVNGALRAAAWLPAREPGKIYNMLDLIHSTQ